MAAPSLSEPPGASCEELLQLEEACVLGRLEDAKRLVQGGANPNASLDADGRTPLIIACCTGRLEQVQYWMSVKGVDPGVSDNFGNSAIDHAARQEYCEIVEWMKGQGVKHSWFGAAAAGDYMRLKEFLDNGQDVNEEGGKHGWNAMEEAIHGGQAKVARWLATQGGILPIREQGLGVLRNDERAPATP